jgi:ABC-type glycerol-3-phosphate transport system permease component
VNPTTEPLFEIAPRENISAPLRRRTPVHWRAVLLLVPAVTLTAAVLAGPLLVALVDSFTSGRGGLDNYRAVLADPAVRHAMVNSLRWLVFAPLICLAGLLLAWLCRRRRWLMFGALAAPAAVSALVAGVAFRLLFDPQPGVGTITALVSAAGGHETFLGPGRIWLVLGLAFSWQWLGLAALVLRAGMVDIPAGLLRMARAFGAGRLRRAWAVALPALFPAGALVLIVVLVAAARVFELVLVAAPGAVQDQVDVVGVHLWRFGPLLGTGESSALAVLLLAFVAAVALAGLWGLRREWPTGRAGPAGTTEDAGPADDKTGDEAGEPDAGEARVAGIQAAGADADGDSADGDSADGDSADGDAAGGSEPASDAPGGGEPAAGRRWTGRRAAATTVGTVAAAVWLLPIITLVLTSLHTPQAAARAGWWAGGWGWGSYRAAFADGQLLPTLGTTAIHAVFAAVLLLILAVPAAYALAWGGLPGSVVRVLVAVTTVLAVLPPQVVAAPLGSVLDHLQLLGAATALILVHVAFGVPLAVLLLRGAFASVPREDVLVRQLDPVPGSALLAVVTRCWPALLTVAVVEIVLVWNDLVIGLLFGGTEAGAVTLNLFEQTRQFATSTGPLAAAAVLVTLVPLALILGTGRWLARGFAEGVRR